MNPIVELNLALILFLPWYALLGWVFWRMRARGGSGMRKLLALAFLAVALAAAGFTGVWAYGFADIARGAIWRQIFACMLGYWAFLGVLVAGYSVLPLRSLQEGRAETENPSS